MITAKQAGLVKVGATAFTLSKQGWPESTSSDEQIGKHSMQVFRDTQGRVLGAVRSGNGLREPLRVYYIGKERLRKRA